MKRRFGAFLLCWTMLTLVMGGSMVHAADTVRIGVIYPLSGGAAAEGRELKAGAGLAAEIANSSYQGIQMDMAKRVGIASLGGAQIELIFRDHEGNPALGVDLARKLIQNDNVIGIIGCYHSAVTKAVSGVCEETGIPMINDSSTSPALTARGFKWFWRITPHDVTFTRDLFEFLNGLTEGKARGIPALPKAQIRNLASACEKTEWGSQVSETIGILAGEFDFGLKKSLLYAANSPDLTSEVRSLKSANPDIMLFASYSADAILMMKTLKAEKACPKMIWGQDAGFEDSAFRSTLGDDVIGVLTRTVFAPQVGQLKALSGQINFLYRKNTGRDLNGTSARAFTGVQTWVEILEKAGSTAPAAIQQAANSIVISGDQLIVPWKGVRFAASGSDQGQNGLGAGMIGQYQKNSAGEIVLEIVYPFDMATAQLIYPLKGF